MSWDVVMIRTKTNSERLDEIKSENIIPFIQAEIAGEIKKIAMELGAAYACNTLSWQWLGSEADSEPVWDIEFNIGEKAEEETVMLHLRGNIPKAAFIALITDLNARLIDCGTGEDLETKC
ncbi:MAG: hypothetical protein NC126_04420 [Clostridium sp.]|nr:hypothetical protein [Clostridium sp.]